MYLANYFLNWWHKMNRSSSFFCFCEVRFYQRQNLPIFQCKPDYCRMTHGKIDIAKSVSEIFKMSDPLHGVINNLTSIYNQEDD